MAYSSKATVVPTARRFLEKGQFDRALQEYRRAAGQDDDPRIWHRIGDVYHRRGSLDEAFKSYGRSALGYASAGFYAKAAALYKQMLALQPDCLDIHLRLAELYQGLGLGGDARRQLKVADQMCAARGRGMERLRVERKMLDLDPENVSARLALAKRYAEEGMREQAGRDFAWAARSLRKSGRMDEFLQAGESALALGIDDSELARMVAHAHLERGNPGLAIERLRSRFEAHPEDVGTLDLLASAFEQQGRPDLAVCVLRALARLLHCDGRLAHRDATYRRILVHAPDDSDAREALGMPAVAVAEKDRLG